MSVRETLVWSGHTKTGRIAWGHVQMFLTAWNECRKSTRNGQFMGCHRTHCRTTALAYVWSNGYLTNLVWNLASVYHTLQNRKDSPSAWDWWVFCGHRNNKAGRLNAVVTQNWVSIMFRALHIPVEKKLLIMSKDEKLGCLPEVKKWKVRKDWLSLVFYDVVLAFQRLWSLVSCKLTLHSGTGGTGPEFQSVLTSGPGLLGLFHGYRDTCKTKIKWGRGNGTCPNRMRVLLLQNAWNCSLSLTMPVYGWGYKVNNMVNEKAKCPVSQLSWAKMEVHEWLQLEIKSVCIRLLYPNCEVGHVE